MQNTTKRMFPEWCSDNITEFFLCLSDDIDSLLSCVFLSQFKDYEISHFYSFDKIYKSTVHSVKNKVIGVDIDFTKGKAWGNHVTMLSNQDKYNFNCANINVVHRISRENYTSKFCGSTLLQILSYYDYDISNLSEEAKMILLAIDSSYLPFYNNYFKDTGTYWMKDILEFPQLVELTKKYKQSDFEALNNKYNLKSKIIVNDDGYLSTDIDLASLSEVFLMPISLPEQKFEILKEFLTYSSSIISNNYNLKKGKDIFSLAVTNRNFVKYSKVV